MKTAIKIIGVILFVSIIGVYWLTSGNFMKKSGISNCVVVEYEADFDGEYLKHSRHVLFERIPTPDCLQKDQVVDKGDGPRKGKVRWAECTFGPDCDEAGMF